MDKQRYCAECPLYDRPQMPQQYPDNPDILFVGGFPLDMDIKYGAFMGKNSALLRHVVERMRKTMNFNLIADYTYACQCQPEYDHKAKKFLVDAKVFARCTAILRSRIDRNRPKAIVALGADALKALGFKEKPADLRGGIFSFESNGAKIPVVATFHVVAVSKSPGYLPTLEKDIGKACAIARGGLPEMEMRISTPVKVDEIINELDRALACAAKSMAEKKSPLAISVDTETTSLKPWLKEERVIAVSMSWEDAQGLAYRRSHFSGKHGSISAEQSKLANIFVVGFIIAEIPEKTDSAMFRKVMPDYVIDVTSCEFSICRSRNIRPNSNSKSGYYLTGINAFGHKHGHSFARTINNHIVITVNIDNFPILIQNMHGKSPMENGSMFAYCHTGFVLGHCQNSSGKFYSILHLTTQNIAIKWVMRLPS